MQTQQYNPTLRDLVKVDNLPANLGFIQGPLGDFLDKFYYANLQEFKSPKRDSASYTLDIILHRQLTLLEIPGTGIAFVVNPPDPAGVQSGSVFNVSFQYQWEILKYINGIKIENFGFDVSSYVNMLANIFGISAQEMLEEAITVFLGDSSSSSSGDPLQDFVNIYNAKYSPGLSYTSGDTFSDIYNQILAAGQNVLDLIKDNFLKDGFENLKRLLVKWIGPLD
jgi:hypothetical protein